MTGNEPHESGGLLLSDMSVSSYFVVNYYGRTVKIMDDSEEYDYWKHYFMKNRIPFNSDLIVWKPGRSKRISNIPFYIDIRLPRGFTFILGDSFRPHDIGHELSVYIQTLEMLDRKRKQIYATEKCKRKAFWKSQSLSLLLSPRETTSEPFRDEWFVNDTRHTFLKSYCLSMIHKNDPMNIYADWEWFKSWFKKQYSFPITCVQKKFPIHSETTLVQNVLPVNQIITLVKLARKHLILKEETTKHIEHLYIHNHASFRFKPQPHFYTVNINHISIYKLLLLMKQSKRIYRPSILPCTELLIIGLAVSGSEIVIPNSIAKTGFIDPLFKIHDSSIVLA